ICISHNGCATDFRSDGADEETRVCEGVKKYEMEVIHTFETEEDKFIEPAGFELMDFRTR
ncbi:hypothetical protein L9F63_006286, partial [Diploptera punctata]